MQAWALSLLAQICAEVLKWAFAQLNKDVEIKKEAAEKKTSDTARDVRNEQKYDQAKTRAEQIKAALDIINRNN